MKSFVDQLGEVGGLGVQLRLELLGAGRGVEVRLVPVELDVGTFSYS